MVVDRGVSCEFDKSSGNLLTPSIRPVPEPYKTYIDRSKQIRPATALRLPLLANTKSCHMNSERSKGPLQRFVPHEVHLLISKSKLHESLWGLNAMTPLSLSDVFQDCAQTPQLIFCYVYGSLQVMTLIYRGLECSFAANLNPALNRSPKPSSL